MVLPKYLSKYLFRLFLGVEEAEAYGEYTYTYEEYAAYYGMLDTENYGNLYYSETNNGETNVGENNLGENNVDENDIAENVVTSAESSAIPGNTVTFASASAGLEKALQSPIPRPAIGLPPPEIPTSTRPPRPHPSPFDNIPVEKESKKKKTKKVWKSSKSRKKDS